MVQAIGMIECRSLPAVLEAASVMTKNYPIVLLGYEKTGSGVITVLISGPLQKVKTAIEHGVTSAQSVGEVLSLHVINNPPPSLFEAPGLSITDSSIK